MNAPPRHADGHRIRRSRWNQENALVRARRKECQGARCPCRPMNDGGRLAVQATSGARENLLRTRILLRFPKCNQVKSGFAQIVRRMRCAWDDPPDLNCRAKSYSAADHLITPGASKKTLLAALPEPIYFAVPKWRISAFRKDLVLGIYPLLATLDQLSHPFRQAGESNVVVFHSFPMALGIYFAGREICA